MPCSFIPPHSRFAAAEPARLVSIIAIISVAVGKRTARTRTKARPDRLAELERVDLPAGR
jgi:hypothetical protein